MVIHHAYYAASMSRGLIVVLIVSAVLFAVAAILFLEWLLPERKAPVVREPPHVVTPQDWNFPRKDTRPV